MKILQLLVLLFFFTMSTSCARGEEDDMIAHTNFPASDSLQARTTKDSIGYYTIKKTGLNVNNSIVYGSRSLSSQGIAISNNILYRFFDTGICQTYDITDIDNPFPVFLFELGSKNNSNHCNAAQFGTNDYNKTSFLYVAGLKGMCYVEEIRESSSVLVQKISLRQIETFFNTNSFNIISGDDPYLWIFGSHRDKLIFGKARKPSVDEGDVELSENDILDYWYEPGYIYSENAWQGGKVYQGKLYFVFGSVNTHKHIAIYDLSTHKKIDDIELNDFVYEEPEDCEIMGDSILLTTYGGKGYYIISKEGTYTGIQSVKL